MVFKELTSIPVIDAHVHAFPQKLFEAIKRWFETNAWGFHKDGTAEECIQAQFDKGVAGLVMMSYAHRPGISREINTFTGTLLRRFPLEPRL